MSRVSIDERIKGINKDENGIIQNYAVSLLCVHLGVGNSSLASATTKSQNIYYK